VRVAAFAEVGLATIQRSLLIEAPVAVSFTFWCDFEAFPQFIEPLSRVVMRGPDDSVWELAGGEGPREVLVRVIQREPERLLQWEFDSGPQRQVTVTFAPLEGGATWFTYTLEYDAPEATDRSRMLDGVSRRLDRELRHARELIEDRSRVAEKSPESGKSCA
jgi:uncharacterized membrane protein